MRKQLLAALSLSLLLSACSGAPTAETSARSAELAAQYEYYEKSAENIEKNMKVTPDQADSIFLTLVDCGVANEINNISSRGENTYAAWSDGNEYTVTLDNGAVSTVYDGKDQLYPEQVHHNDLMDYDLIVKDVMNGTGDAVIGQYAYISIMGQQLSDMTAENLQEFAEQRVEGSGYNWVSIISTDGKGICFTGSDTSSGIYGTLNQDGSVAETLGFWERQPDGSYIYSAK